MSVLEINNIKKKFGNNEVLRGISFSLEEGEVLSVIGSSGSGKTTLLRCLNFLERADEGTIAVDGNVIFDASQKGRVSEREIRKMRLNFGLVFQDFNLFPQYSVMDNLLLAPKLLAKEDPEFKHNKKPLRCLQKSAFRIKRTLTPASFPAGRNSVFLSQEHSAFPRVCCSLMSRLPRLIRN